ncbi:MAG: hypothetical protein D6788_08095 [Planctomycetota bacterium]|nr:MAG: hypothetical protein D6788_08095 [Planctomycetota bacterium]
MADDKNPAPESPAKKGKGKLMPLLVVGGMMLAEGVGVFFLAKALSPTPVPALGAGLDLSGEKPEDEEGLREVELGECRPSNNLAGKFVIFQVRVSVLVAAEDFERVKELAKAREARIKDRINAVIRSSEPKDFDEPDFATIKRRLKKELDVIFGDETLIREVLIPELLQSTPGV